MTDLKVEALRTAAETVKTGNYLDTIRAAIVFELYLNGAIHAKVDLAQQSMQFQGMNVEIGMVAANG